jgi:hypothetical protein
MSTFVTSGDFGHQPPPRAILLKNSDFQRRFRSAYGSSLLGSSKISGTAMVLT